MDLFKVKTVVFNKTDSVMRRAAELPPVRRPSIDYGTLTTNRYGISNVSIQPQVLQQYFYFHDHHNDIES